MQQAKKPFRTRFQLLLRLTLNAGKHPGNQPARLAQLDDGNDCAILVQGDEGPAQVVQLGHRGTPSVICQRRWCHLLAACPIPSLRWREMDSNLYGAFPVKWLFWVLLRVLCSERDSRSSSRRLRSGSRSARKGSRDRNASIAWRLAA